ncbi:NUDIX hydrolase [Magnetospirillum sp. UT-4]|uniref:NUDIX hydrolase n=1 Tax=Magnetospirillum sp. UT-4 TaxID=2681467 RepID=UPI001383EF16|nr:NUDIX hydrolase [Magnetospirillum sp. UT-4]CAA7626474.1 NUDIX hydrolase [Magnetospirillum sp. UT-4]
MPRLYPPAPLAAAIAAVVRDGRVLLVQRAREPEPRRWGFPGGAVELGETVTGAALRELAEETGVAAAALGVFDAFDVIERDADGRVRTHFVVAAVACRWLAGDGIAASDACALGWFDLDGIAALHVHPHLPRLAARVLGAT